MPPMRSDPLNENAVTGQSRCEAIFGDQVLTVESDLERIRQVNQAIREGRCKISRLDSNYSSDCSQDKESVSGSPSS
jgi:hypothetical protein